MLHILLFYLWASFLRKCCAESVVVVDLFVASKCPDAVKCETSFLPEVLRQVGSIVDIRMDYIAEEDPGAPWGYQCMHGDSECEGNILQLCVQQHFPVSHDIEGLGKHSWYGFLQCVDEDYKDIPSNTEDCLSALGVPPNVIDEIYECTKGEEGGALMAASVARTQRLCGGHASSYHHGCKSCEMFINEQPSCVEDGGMWYNCSTGHTAEEWVKAICDAYDGEDTPSACWIPQPGDRPRVVGHSFASVNPMASVDFVVKYFGATFLERESHGCEKEALAAHVRMPLFEDWRGGGLYLSFVSNPNKPGGSYDVHDYVKSMGILYGNLSDNTHHQWNQFFDNHLGLYVSDSRKLVDALLEDHVPFWTGIDDGYYQSVYIEIPGTGTVVEVLGDFVREPPIPSSHIRIGSTQQFCTPIRRRKLQLTYPLDPSADRNKTTWASADPPRALEFVCKYLGGTEIHQKRGVVADGQCALLKWVRWPDGHEWHLVDTMQTDWVSKEGLRPQVPFNITEFARYLEEEVRDVPGDVYDQYMDYAEIMEVDDLDPLVQLLRQDGVSFLVRGFPSQGACRVILNIPANAITVHVSSKKFGSIQDLCVSQPWDLCAGA